MTGDSVDEAGRTETTWAWGDEHNPSVFISDKVAYSSKLV